MSRLSTYANSDSDDDDLERRNKARFQLTVFAVVTEPAYQVSCDPSEKQVIVEIRERTYGDSISGDDAIMHLRFGTPSALRKMSEALMNAGNALATILDHASNGEVGKVEEAAD